MVYWAGMIRLFTTWLMLILLTALPLHAGAARIAMACAAPAGACHEQAAGVTAAHAQTTLAAAPAHNDGAPHASCNTCSALCMAACLPPACLAIPAITASENVSIATAALAAGYIPDGPLRPPRHA